MRDLMFSGEQQIEQVANRYTENCYRDKQRLTQSQQLVDKKTLAFLEMGGCLILGGIAQADMQGENIQ